MKECHRIQELFSPCLDGELTPDEAARLREHCDACPECRAALTEWQSAAQVLRENDRDIVAPPGFSAGVMARIAAAKPAPRPWWAGGWAKGLAAAAAAAMVFAGSWGLLGGQVGTRLPQIADNNPGDVSSVIPPADDHYVAPLVPNDVITDPDSSDPSDPTDLDPVPVQPAQPNAAQPPQTNTTAPRATVKPDADAPVAFLKNKERTITTTLLRVTVTDLADAREQALAMAKDAGAACRDRTASSGVLEITAPAASAADLTGRLAALGSVEVRDTDKKNITPDFTAALERCQTLAAQLETTEDPEQRAHVEATMASLEKQLQDWDAQSSRHVITLWLAE